MKKLLIFVLLAFFDFCLFAEEYKLEKVAVFDNSEASLPVRNHLYGGYGSVDENGDASGNFICFSNEGELYIQNWDRNKLLKVNQMDFSIDEIHNLNFLQFGHLEHLSRVEKDYYLFESFTGASVSTMVDKYFNTVYSFNVNRINIPYFTGFTYYDFDTNILFYEDNNYKLCSIVHPSSNLEQNKKNVRNHEQTVYMLQNKTDIDVGNLLYIEGKGLFKGKEKIFIGGYVLNNNLYKKFSEYEIYISMGEKEKIINMKDETEAEELESIAIHPSGDLYALRYNQKTKLHTLYRIENTWDNSYRKEWYKAHPVLESSSKSGRQTTSSASSFPGKTLACSDNLRLRAEDSSSSSVVVSMLKGTKVKVLKKGHEETIDGIKNNWVQVEVLDGAKDKDGKAIKAGTKGWCFAGYLE